MCCVVPSKQRVHLLYSKFSLYFFNTCINILSFIILLSIFVLLWAVFLSIDAKVYCLLLMHSICLCDIYFCSDCRVKMSTANKFVCLQDYEENAKQVLPTFSLDYYRGGADQEQTLQDNRYAFKRYSSFNSKFFYCAICTVS